MSVVPPTISFLLVILFAVLVCASRTRSSVPELAVVVWLLVGNLIQGINSLIWSGNLDVHVPVWCDIVTRIVYAVGLGASAALLCTSQELKELASTNLLLSDPVSRRKRKVIELVVCYCVPVLYMLLHFIVQDYRFDIVKNLGCMTASHSSLPSILVVWLPPLALSMAAFFCSCAGINNAYAVTSAVFSCHIQNRSALSSSQFFRHLTRCLLVSAAIVILCFFAMVSPTLKPWGSWTAVHSHMSSINFVTGKQEFRNSALTWWCIPAVSSIFILLSAIIGEEVRDIFQSIRDGEWKKPSFFEIKKKASLPLSSRTELPTTVSRSASLTRPQSQTQLHTLELKSGWDDMLDSKSSKGTASKLMSKLRPTGSSPSPTPSMSSRTQSVDDEAFLASTMTYLGSPMAQSLGLSTPLLVPPTVRHKSPRKTSSDLVPATRQASLDRPASPSSRKSDQKARSLTPEAVAVPVIKTAAQPLPVDVSSPVWAEWPEPPSAPSSLSLHDGRSRSHTTCSSQSDDTFGHPSKASAPYQSPSLTSVLEDIFKNRSRGLPQRQSIRSLQSSWSRDRTHKSQFSGDVIYMTSVAETA